MDLKKVYEEVLKRLETIDVNKIYPGFELYDFALYDDNLVCLNNQLIDKTQEFMANTAIEYKGNFIAIWKLEEGIDLDILASKLAHEMFHAHQMKHKEQRFPNELDSLYNYQYNFENLSLKYQENQLITQLTDHFDSLTFEKFLSFRKRRFLDFPYEFLYETSIEEIEGSANYVELEVLKKLSFDKYQKKLNMMKEQLINIDQFFPIRIISYDIGALLLKILTDNLKKINLAFDNVSFSVKLIHDIIPYQGEIKKMNDIEEAIRKYDFITNEIIQKALKMNKIVAEGEFDLLGVNIYNARYNNPYLVSTYFVMYMDKEDKIIKQGNFVLELAKSHKIKRIFEY